jgi:DMSO reductase family type II enzyme chaperone
MSAMAVLSVDEATSARSELYGLLADALEFPDREFHERVNGGGFREEVDALVSALPYEIGDDLDAAALSEAGEYVEFQSEYMRLFDIGPVRPPCPLYGGEWGGARKRSMEEALRFYRFFGLKMDEETHELPDHVTVELEFMKVIAFAEGMARAREKDALPFLRAERDFLDRHLGRWFPMLRRKLPTQQPSPFYDALTRLTAAVLASDQGYLRSLLV